MKCLNCNNEYQDNDFGRHCSRLCRSTYNKAMQKTRSLAYRAKTADLPITRYKQYKGAASARGLDFALDMNEFMEYWQKPCYYCGSEIKTIGLDRMDNDKGYLIDNIAPCCTRCNLSKYKSSSAEFIAFCKLVASRF